jgi:hypothetical protein
MWLNAHKIIIAYTDLIKTHSVMWMREDSGREILIPSKGGQMDLGVKKQWGFFGADVRLVDNAGGQSQKV